MLRGLDGISDVRLHIDLPAQGPLDLPRARANVTVLLIAGGTIEKARAEALIRGAAPELSEARLTIETRDLPERHARARTELVQVGPFRVTAATARGLRLALAAALAANVLLATLLLARLRRTSQAT